MGGGDYLFHMTETKLIIQTIIANIFMFGVFFLTNKTLKELDVQNVVIYLANIKKLFIRWYAKMRYPAESIHD